MHILKDADGLAQACSNISFSNTHKLPQCCIDMLFV